MNQNPNQTRILVIPYPAQGHMIPILDLTHHLAATGRFHITVVVTPKNLPILSPLLSSSVSSAVSPLVLPFPAVSGVPSGAENTKDLPPASFRPMMLALSQLQDPLRQWYQSLSSPPVAVISDIFCGWTHRFAADLGMKSLVFSPSGAMALSVIYSLWRTMPKEEEHKNGDVLFSDVPNCPKYPWWQLSPVYRSYVEGEGISEFIKQGFRDNMASWGLVINTFDELERDYLSHLKKMLCHDRVWAVGPLIPPEEESSAGINGYLERGGSSSGVVHKIISWLDTCEDNEVVYVAFGTQAILTGKQMEAVAEGLEKSGARFIWCAREPKSPEHVAAGYGKVPPLFEDRVAGRGMIIRGWAPQVAILRHRAVGTFLTHFGWNSILEGIMSGVQLLAWPMGADQFSNATLLVDQLKVAVRICEGASSIPKSDELARAVAGSVNSTQPERRLRIEKLSNEAVEAVKEKGSSAKALLGLMEALNGWRTKP